MVIIYNLLNRYSRSFTVNVADVAITAKSMNISLAESQKGIILAKQCSTENKKDVIAIDFV